MVRTVSGPPPHTLIPPSVILNVFSVLSKGGAASSTLDAAPESCPPDSDPPPAFRPVVPSAAAVDVMRRGTSLQSRRSTASGSVSAERDPLLRASPPAPRRRNTVDPQQLSSRPRSSSTNDSAPGPAPVTTGTEAVLSSGYQSTEEADRVSGARGDSTLSSRNYCTNIQIKGREVSDLVATPCGHPLVVK